MSTSDNILDFLKDHPYCGSPDLCRHLTISRQALHKHMKSLISDGKVQRSGRGKSTRYTLPGKHQPVSDENQSLTRNFTINGLSEDTVFTSFANLLSLQQRMNPYAYDILQYAFTEMLNNAIDHSKADHCRVTVSLNAFDVEFEIRDRGIGVFSSIHKKLQLADELDAVNELMKGRTTTMKERHSGEGIFFTSRLADRFSLTSHRTELSFDQSKADIFLREVRFRQGTNVTFRISRKSRRDMNRIFTHFAPADWDFKFERTELRVQLLNTTYISRSEARRLLRNVEKYQEVILDFHGVRAIGQGFADEVFRIFPAHHPHIRLKVKNAAPVVEQIIKHVVDE